MDLSKYYEDFQLTYNISIFSLCLTIFAVVFIGVRSLRDKKETLKKKIVNWGLLLLIFSSVLTNFMLGPYLAKKDIDQKTIYCYEGIFEIVETSNGIYNKAVFSFENQEITLKYSENETAYDAIKPGKYEGKLVYAQHVAQVVDLEIYKSQFN